MVMRVYNMCEQQQRAFFTLILNAGIEINEEIRCLDISHEPRKLSYDNCHIVQKRMQNV